MKSKLNELNIQISPEYTKINEWDFYSSDVLTEFQQCIDEGLDVAEFNDRFIAVSEMDNCEEKNKEGDRLFSLVSKTEMRNDYPYNEPSDLNSIRELNKAHSYQMNNTIKLNDKITGAWMGRICGCMLGKTVEGIRTDELIPFLKETDNYPMHRYILSTDITDETKSRYKFGFNNNCFADTSDGMPVDDDTNYTVLYQEIIEKYGRDFTSDNIAEAWIEYQSRNAYFTAERVAYCNFINGFTPPYSAMYKNPYREYIGAQIRGDYFGYINPGKPEIASEMAWRDARISHTKNGIYGEMFVAAMLAVAAETNCIKDIILGGLSQIPYTSRLYSEIMSVLRDFENGVSQEQCFINIHSKYDEHTGYGWCHTIPNAMIVAASLLYGGGNFADSVCMAVETGFDTDCNAATVGSILGMAFGIENIPSKWTDPLHDILHTSIFGVGTVKISDRIKITLSHLE